MNEGDLDRLVDIFYENSPYDYVLSISNRKPKRVRGLCAYKEKVCIVFSPEDYLSGLFVTLHELAHAIIQHKTHSETWEKAFVNLLIKYDYPRNLVALQAEALGPNLRKYIGDN